MKKKLKNFLRRLFTPTINGPDVIVIMVIGSVMSRLLSVYSYEEHGILALVTAFAAWAAALALWLHISEWAERKLCTSSTVRISLEVDASSVLKELERFRDVLAKSEEDHRARQ